MDEEEKKMVKMEVKFDPYDGDVKFNLLSILSDYVSDEEKESLLSDNGWMSFFSNAIIDSLVNGYSSMTYNNYIHRLRTGILTRENLPEMLKNWVETERGARMDAQEGEQYWQRAYWKLYHLVRENNNSTYPCEIKVPELPRRYFGKKYSREVMERVRIACMNFGLLFPEEGEEEINA